MKRSNPICLFTCYSSLKNADSDSEYKDAKEVVVIIQQNGKDLEVAKVAL
jgi:hypothetical protein